MLLGQDAQEAEEELKETEAFLEQASVSMKKIPSTKSQGQTALDKIKLKKMDSKNILVAGTSEGIVSFMSDKLKLQGCNVQVALTGQTVVSKALRFKPDIILLEVNMDGLSANEVINALKKDTTVHTQILLYSYFLTPESEKTSIVNAYYTNQFEHVPHPDSHENQPVYYFGAFHKNSFLDRIKKFISYSF